MAKIIITITEKILPVPRHENERMAALEADYKIEFTENENAQTLTLLPKLLPIVQAAIKAVFAFALGQPIILGDDELTSNAEERAAEILANRLDSEMDEFSPESLKADFDPVDH